MPNKGLDVVQVKLVMDKTLYSEEQLSSPDQVVQFMRKELSEYDREVFCILNCTTKSQVINMNIVSMGTINASLVTGREVFKSAILSHNHPSGDPQPSHHDFLVTSKLCAGGNILGIDVLDHIIVGGR
ncbi:JAB domain-containing protein, partial [Mediterraneibacter gnavus]|uniref:JAB domain-containing protein n=1 Tax=Mediterraneibacter gnavus TaxID=33038 RepID=UPI0022E2D7D3